MKTIALLLLLLSLAAGACPKGYIDTGGGGCVICEAGTYAEVDVCRPCLKGTFAPTSGQTTCIPCGDGWVAPTEGSAECQPCPDNFRSVGVTNCIPCQAGFFRNGSAIVCSPCLPGTAMAQTHGCLECGPGFHSPYPGSTVCPPCPPGTFAAGSGVAECELCEIGYYSVEGTTACLQCPIGQTTTTRGGECVDASAFKLPCNNLPKAEDIMAMCIMGSVFFFVITLLSRFAFPKILD